MEILHGFCRDPGVGQPTRRTRAAAEGCLDAAGGGERCSERLVKWNTIYQWGFNMVDLRVNIWINIWVDIWINIWVDIGVDIWVAMVNYG